MNSNLKNIIVTSGFAGCALILTAIVSIGSTKVNQVHNTNTELLAKAKIENSTTSTQQVNQQLK